MGGRKVHCSIVDTLRSLKVDIAAGQEAFVGIRHYLQIELTLEELAVNQRKSEFVQRELQELVLLYLLSLGLSVVFRTRPVNFVAIAVG